MELSVKQWKALVLAYPLYNDLSSGEERRTGDDAESLPPDFSTFVDVAVPKIEVAFAAILSSSPVLNASFSSAKGGAPPVRKPLWRNTIPRPVDRLLSLLFACESDEEADAGKEDEDNSEEKGGNCRRTKQKAAQLAHTAVGSLTGEACNLRPLSFSEIQLLYLLHKEKRKTDAIAAELEACKEQLQRARLGLASVAQSADLAAAAAGNFSRCYNNDNNTNNSRSNGTDIGMHTPVALASDPSARLMTTRNVDGEPLLQGLQTPIDQHHYHLHRQQQQSTAPIHSGSRSPPVLAIGERTAPPHKHPSSSSRSPMGGESDLHGAMSCTWAVNAATPETVLPRHQCTNTDADADVAGRVFVSELASVHYHEANRVERDGCQTAGSAGYAGSVGSPAFPLLSINVVCEECGEVGGELFRCRRCGSVKHEACGGPHPLSSAPTKTAGGSHTAVAGQKLGIAGSSTGVEAVRGGDEEEEGPSMEGLCRSCRKDINLFSSSSSSAMHSSTSSEERREIDAYFGKGSDASSLSGTSETDSDDSGFIVHTSDDSDFSKESGEEDRRSSSSNSDGVVAVDEKETSHHHSRRKQRSKRSTHSSLASSLTSSSVLSSAPSTASPPPSSSTKRKTQRDEKPSTGKLRREEKKKKKSAHPEVRKTHRHALEARTKKKASKRRRTHQRASSLSSRGSTSEDELAVLGVSRPVTPVPPTAPTTATAEKDNKKNRKTKKKATNEELAQRATGGDLGGKHGSKKKSSTTTATTRAAEAPVPAGLSRALTRTPPLTSSTYSTSVFPEAPALLSRTAAATKSTPSGNSNAARAQTTKSVKNGKKRARLRDASSSSSSASSSSFG